MLVFNILKTVFVMIKYKMHPFTWPMIIISLFLMVAICLPLLLPVIFKSIVLSILISGSVIMFYVIVGYKLNISIEINRFMHQEGAKIHGSNVKDSSNKPSVRLLQLQI